MKDGNLTILVAIPAYNAEKYLRDNLESVISLDPPPDRIVVIDDGSSDETARIANSFREVELISHKKNMGLAASRNSALKNCNNDIILFFDSDTVVEKTFIQKIKTCYDDNVAGVGGIAVEKERDSLLYRWREVSMKQARRNSDEVPFLWGLCSSYRVSALNDVGGFDPAFRTNGEDVDMGVRLRGKGYSLVSVPQAKVLHLKKENFKSILKTIYNWYFWGAYALKKNGEHYIASYIKMILMNPLRRISSMHRFPLHPYFLMMDLLALLIQSTALFRIIFSGREAR